MKKIDIIDLIIFGPMLLIVALVIFILSPMAIINEIYKCFRSIKL